MEYRRLLVGLRTGICLLFVLVTCPTVLAAEFVCSGDVSYRYIPRSENTAPSLGTKVPEGTEAIKSDDSHLVAVKWTTVRRTAKEEGVARREVGQFMDRERHLALAGCRETHENLARCITAKFTSSAQAMAHLGFSARKALEQAVQQDCQALQGGCRDVVLGEITCASAADPSAAAASTAATEPPQESAPKDGGKEKAKKK